MNRVQRSFVCPQLTFAISVVLILMRGVLTGGALSTPISLVIKIEDPARLPVGAANVTVSAVDGQWRSQGVTSDEGVLRFTALPVGAYQLRIDATGSRHGRIESRRAPGPRLR